MVDDLVFRRPPLDGPPNVLVFGEPEEAASGAAHALGRIPLPAFMLSGGALVKRPPNVLASGRIPLPAFMVRGTANYSSAVSRPLMGKVSAGWQVARQIEGGALARHQNAAPARATTLARWQKAAPLAGGVAVTWQDAQRARAAAALRYQAARQLEAATAALHQEARRVRAGGSVRWQAAAQLATRPVGVRHQEASRMRREAAARWQQAVGVQLAHLDRFGAALQLDVGRLTRWQAAMYPLPGRSVITPPTDDPCYVPSTTLVFDMQQQYSTTLVFICERHSEPEPGETITVPIRRAYIVQNNITLVRVDSGEVLEATAFAMSLDADSWTWQWSATLPWSALPIIKRDIRSGPVDILATVNGVPYRLAAENYRRDRRFADAKVQVQGRGRAAMLGAPSSPVLNHQSAAPRSIAQLMELALTYNGVGIGWGIDFGITDWAVPGGTWNFQGTHIDAVLDIASAAGAIVQPHRTDATLRILPRYPVAPWHWNTVAPDFVLPAAAVSVEGIEYTPKPDYNRVFVAGANAAGVLGQITRAGTAGDSIAPMVTHPLMTHSDGAQQRGLAVLGDTGLQASVSLRLQVLPETGLILPGAMVRYEDGAESHLGLVRSTGLDWQRPTLRQTLILETHPEA